MTLEKLVKRFSRVKHNVKFDLENPLWLERPPFQGDWPLSRKLA